jgi:hypothetical protein
VDEYVRRMYLKEEEFLEEYVGTVEAAVDLLHLAGSQTTPATILRETSSHVALGLHLFGGQRVEQFMEPADLPVHAGFDIRGVEPRPRRRDDLPKAAFVITRTYARHRGGLAPCGRGSLPRNSRIHAKSR